MVIVEQFSDCLPLSSGELWLRDVAERVPTLGSKRQHISVVAVDSKLTVDPRTFGADLKSHADISFR